MIQGRLGSLVGRSSGYIESLPAAVRRRVAGLKGIQQEHAKFEAEFQEEVLQLEKKYFAKFTPLYEKRSAIVNGKAEPTDDEVKEGEIPESEEPEAAEGEEAKPAEKPAEEPAEPVSGIPEFWLSAMKNQPSLAEMITDRDEAALKHLIDIRMEYLDKPGFRLIFDFAENEFFENKTLTKTYYYQAESGYGGDFIYDHAEGHKVEWKAGKDLTVRVESKKQRNKSKWQRMWHALTSVCTSPCVLCFCADRLAVDTKQTRVVKKSIPTESFFNFFAPPVPPGDDDEGESMDDIEERLEMDYQLGEDIKEKLIPRAIDWFTGEALQYEEMDEDDLEGIQYDEDDDEDDDDDLSDDQDEDDSDDEV